MQHNRKRENENTKDGNNYRGVILIPIPYKILRHIVLDPIWETL